jgi:hypothetical protein
MKAAGLFFLRAIDLKNFAMTTETPNREGWAWS